MELEKFEKNIRAIRAIRPKACFSVGETYSSLTWHDDGNIEGENQTKPTEKEFNDALVAFNNAHDALQYQRDRIYPPIGDQLDALYHAGVFPKEMSDKLKAVKDAHPKPE
tara:strand:- start:52 stop:381 length:330 start_codon:yes stop_codon:yes gene_type:complete